MRSPTDFVCPTCGAQAGMWCSSQEAGLSVTAGTHDARLALALACDTSAFLDLINAASAEEEHPPMEPYWVCGSDLDDENFPSLGDDYKTRDEAIAGAAEELTHVERGGFFQTGRVVQTIEAPASVLYASEILERAADGMSDCGWGFDLCEGWQDKAEQFASDLQKRLDAAWQEWIEANKLRIVVLTIEDIETHPMSAAGEAGE